MPNSYDWLLFLTDQGLAEFITDLLLEPLPELAAARTAFQASYTADKKINSFTKISMDYTADRVLVKYFKTNDEKIKNWFNVISPKRNGHITELQLQLSSLRDKDWKAVHNQ